MRGGVLEQPVLLDGVEDGERGGAGDRVAAEGGAVVAGLRAGWPASPSADAGADRDAAAEALGEGDDVGRRRDSVRRTSAPVRPMPVCTSSSQSSAPLSRVISRAAAR